jgi:glycosyltransferase involved in cell wall biosynthesis
MEPSVSILMPVRNEERLLPAALDSISRQTLSDWELVVVDDGSDDGTLDILEEAAQRDPRMRSMRSPCRGLAAALNLGLDACRAPLVARMDGDDISHPLRLELQTAFMQSHPAIGLTCTAFRHFSRTGLRSGMLAYEVWQNSLDTHDRILRDIFVESPFVHPSVMFRKEEVLSVGGYRDMGWAEDYDLWLRLASAGTRFARLPRVLFFWRDHPERATRTLPDYTAAAFRACKLHHLQQGFLKGVDGVTLAGAGLEGRAWFRTLQAEGVCVVRWIDVDPRKIGRTLHGAPVVAAGEVKAEDVDKMLVTVGTKGARDLVRKWAKGVGFAEGKDFVCVT